MKGNLQFIFHAFLLFSVIHLALCTSALPFDTTRIFFAGDSSTTFCRESTGGTDLYHESLFSKLQALPPPGFTIEPRQDIVTREPCAASHPDISGYGGLKILDLNTECTDPSGEGVCSWFCIDCPTPECDINRSSDLFGELDWCCCASRRSCINQSDAQYIILNLLGNDLLQLFKFYSGDVDVVIQEAQSLTNYVTAQGRTVFWLTFYPLGYVSLGNGKSLCSDVLSCLFATNSNAEYFYEQFFPWVTSQPKVYLIDFFGYIKASYAPNPISFIDTYGYDGIHLKPSGHQIYYDFVYTQLVSILSEINDQDEDGLPDIIDNCANHYNPNQEDAFPPQGNNCGDACECEGNFDGDEDQDGSDAVDFKVDFGRSPFGNPCGSGNPCNGDFDCDNDCDGTDAFTFKEDFGRSTFLDPCPYCVMEPWCTYP